MAKIRIYKLPNYNYLVTHFKINIMSTIIKYYYLMK